MRLSPRAVKSITPIIRVKIALALGCTENTIIRYLSRGDDNLTKAAALKVIQQETGLSEDEVLTETVEVKEAQDI